MAKRRERDFEEVVRQIARSEDDVDKVLKAAKLQRIERGGWDSEIFIWIVVLIAVLTMPLMMVLTILFD